MSHPIRPLRGFAECCDCGKQSLEPIYCARFPQADAHGSAGPLLPKLRGHFAEFLRESSLARLSAFTLAHLCRLSVRALSLHRLEVFLGTLESTSYQLRRAFPNNVTLISGGFSCPEKHSLPAGHSHSSGWPILMRHPITPQKRGRNINLLSIDYAFRPRLRSRLTLEGRPLSRKP